VDLDLKDRVVVVTAGAGGIGLAVRDALLAEGALVVAADQHAPTSVPDRAVLLELDLLAPSAMRTLVETAHEHHGRLDAVINVLGGPVPATCPLVERDDDSWQRAFELNLLSAVRLVRHAVPRMTEGGSLVHIGSDLARQPDPMFAEYAAMKAALLSVSRSLAEELGPHVRSNVLSPGPTRTPGLERHFEQHIGPQQGLSREQAIQRYVTVTRRITSGRLAEPAEIARVAAFLASPLSAPMTGTEVVVDGGTRKAA
jgi:NAD(P)-dependent dehydrogenase (short-subunit alcohol dehydrogenase family)